MLNLNLVIWNCNRACLAACTVTLVQVDQLEEFVRWYPATHTHAEVVDKKKRKRAYELIGFSR